MANLDAIFDGVIEENFVKPPIAVLKELAQGLEKRTAGLLVGEVTQDYRNSKFCLQFYIRAPSLNNYSYKVFEIRHDLSFYPLRIESTDQNIFKATKSSLDLDESFEEYRYMDAKDQEELEEILKTIFSSPEVKKVINGLLAQSKSAN